MVVLVSLVLVSWEAYAGPTLGFEPLLLSRESVVAAAEPSSALKKRESPEEEEAGGGSQRGAGFRPHNVALGPTWTWNRVLLRKPGPALV